MKANTNLAKLHLAARLTAAPFIGLAYIVALPFLGFGALAWVAIREALIRIAPAARAVRNVGLFFAAPFIGLAYAAAFPFVGAGALVWMAVRAATRHPAVA